jgi:hypothetical protein
VNPPRPLAPSFFAPRGPAGVALLLALVAAGGCQRTGPDGPGDTHDKSLPAASDHEVATIRGLTMGDRACYLELEDVQGQSSDAVADFDLCEREDLVGQGVRLTRERTSILAISCQGDPECTDRDTVDLIVAAEPLP